jgi:hypothetical protein
VCLGQHIRNLQGFKTCSPFLISRLSFSAHTHHLSPFHPFPPPSTLPQCPPPPQVLSLTMTPAPLLQGFETCSPFLISQLSFSAHTHPLASHPIPPSPPPSTLPQCPPPPGSLSYHDACAPLAGLQHLLPILDQPPPSLTPHTSLAPLHTAHHMHPPPPFSASP